MMKVLDFMNDEYWEGEEAEVFQDWAAEGEQPSWEAFLKYVMECAFEKCDVPDISKVDKSVFGYLWDGSTIVRTLDGAWYIICWRRDTCHVWEEDYGEKEYWEKSKEAGELIYPPTDDELISPPEGDDE